MAKREPDRLVRVWTVAHLSRGDFVVGGWKVVYVDCLSKPSTDALQLIGGDLTSSLTRQVCQEGPVAS